MDDRYWLAEAFLGRLREARVRHCVLSDGARGEVELALARDALRELPSLLAAHCRAFDLQLVHLEREDAGWHAVLAWSDEVGRPRFLRVEAFADWWRGGRRLLAADELLAPAPEARFIHRLLACVHRNRIEEDERRQLSALWQREPRGAMEQIARFWRRPSDLRVIAQAARHGSWAEASRRLPELRRAMRSDGAAELQAALRRAARLAREAWRASALAIAFVGGDEALRDFVRAAVERDLAPAFPGGLATVAGPDDGHRRVDLRVLIGGAGAEEGEDEVALEAGIAPAAAVAKAERAILRWLECRVERRHPAALVGENPPGARLLQLACRLRLPLAGAAVQGFFNCDIECRLRAPVLMPHPYGIVIERGARIGNRVTIYEHASLHRTADGAPLVEDNVRIGPGARIVGPVRVGRGATVAPNAVVTRDVPSHCTVAGEDRIVGQTEALSPENDGRFARLS